MGVDSSREKKKIGKYLGNVIDASSLLEFFKICLTVEREFDNI